MNRTELDQALRRLRLSGLAATLDVRLAEAQADEQSHLDFLMAVVRDELVRRGDRLVERRIKQAQFRDSGKRLDTFDFGFNPKIDRKKVFELASGHFVNKRQDALFLGRPGTGKSHLAQAIGHAVILQGVRVLYREAHALVDELVEAQLVNERKAKMAELAAVPLLIIDDLGMRKLPPTAAEDLLELVMRRYERASTIVTSNRPVDDWGKLLGDTASVTAMLDRLLHHGHLLQCGPRSWRTKAQPDLSSRPSAK
ncbi:MAG: IS21-like element helper ATPase IstB [Acidobacteria bacterium]|nr:IS21-like element helper ATPase IstB [Acidobacteriota bacterium]